MASSTNCATSLEAPFSTRANIASNALIFSMVRWRKLLRKNVIFGFWMDLRHYYFQFQWPYIYFSLVVKPFITRQIRSNLTKTAEAASIEVFAINLRQLLLLSPVKGKKILGIDPGFTNGCKIALISECMEVLATAVVFPHTKRHNVVNYGHEIAAMLEKHK